MESRTFQVLEFPKILRALADRAVSEAGITACLEIRPFCHLDEITNSALVYDQAACWIGESGISVNWFPSLDGLFAHLERPSIVLDQDALFTLKQVLDITQSVYNSLVLYNEREWTALETALFPYAWPQKTVSALGRCLDPEGRIRDESSPGLMGVRQEIRSIHQRCTKKVKDFVLRENLSGALQEEFMTISSDRYVLPIKVNFKNKIKGIIHDYSQTGETCYFEPMFLVEMNNRLQELKREEREEEHKVHTYLTTLIRQELQLVVCAYTGLVEFDVLMAKFKLSQDFSGRSALISESGEPHLIKARHPLIALVDEDVHPLDIQLLENQRALIISGGNAGGKTVCLKTLGLIALMAFAGIPVPVAEGSTLPFWSDIFVVMGDEQSLEESVSTFTAQIQYLTRVWDKVGPNTLFILDEFGAGTDPTQGAALAQAVVDSLVEKQTTTLIATHFPALKAYAMATEFVRAASVLFDPGTKKPLYKLAYDQVGASIALDVAREHGLPLQILERAEKYLLLDGSDTSSVLHRLNEIAVKREAELEHIVLDKAKIQQKLSRLEVTFEKKRLSLLKDIQGQAQAVVKQWQAEKLGRKEARKELANVKAKVETLATVTSSPPSFSFEDINPGQMVTYLAWDKGAKVLDINTKKKQAKIDVGGVAMWVKAEHLGQLRKLPKAQINNSNGIAKPLNDVAVEVDLRGNRVDIAISELERALDRALRNGSRQIDIIHGRGTGVLRREVHEFLKHYPAVDRFSLANEEHGGDGKTEVLLK